jgi:hypothetical protein
MILAQQHMCTLRARLLYERPLRFRGTLKQLVCISSHIPVYLVAALIGCADSSA